MELAEARWSLDPRERSAWASTLLSCGLGLLYVLWLIYTSREVGIPRDESVYLYAADRISGWLSWSSAQGVDPLSLRGVERGFGFNHEHPALLKELFALSHSYLHVKWGLIADPTLAYRLPTMLLSALTVSLTSALGARLAGLWAGLGAGVALMAMPRLFFHAHLACFDAPVMAMWLLIVLSYLRAYHQGGGWVLLSGVTLGLGLATKLNATFAPFLLLGVSLIHLLGLKRAHSSELGWTVKRYAWIGGSMITLGLGVFWLHWPWLYHDVWARLLGYIQFHARHEHYPVDYFGALYYRPPLPVSFPFVMLGLTVPLVTLTLGLFGMIEALKRGVSRWRERPEGFPVELLLLVNFIFALVLIALPSTPIFGGTKHWITSLPFLAIFAGVAFERARATLLQSATALISVTRLRGQLISLSFVALCFAPAVSWTQSYGPHGPVWYNSLIGGPSGAAEARLPRDFWGYSSVKVLSTLNERATPKAGVFWHNATGASVWRYQRDGRLRRDLRSTGDWTGPYADWGVYHSQREKRAEELDLWWAYGTTLPVEGYFVDGVQVIGLYQRAQTATQGASDDNSQSPDTQRAW